MDNSEYITNKERGMTPKKADTRFKYVNTIPENTVPGAFYWKYDSGVKKNQLYFSPTDNGMDTLRLDNIVSGQGGSSVIGEPISLVAIYEEPSGQQIYEQNGTVSSWTDDIWESYIESVTDEVQYGTISDAPFLIGNVVICGRREFVCTESKPVCKTIVIDGVEYYKSRNGAGIPCRDDDGNPIEYDGNKTIPHDADIDSYSILRWNCFGENISRDLANKIATFNMELNDSITIRVEENQESEGSFTMYVVLKEKNPLTVTTDERGNRVVEISDDNSDDPTGVETLMSAAQLKDTLNVILEGVDNPDPKWIEGLLL